MAARAFITGLAGLDVSANERAFLREAQPWGLIIFKRNVSTPSQVQALVRSFRNILGWEAPVLVDQEGGRVQRLGPPPWAAFPPGGGYGGVYDRVAGAGVAGRLMAADLHALGIDVDCLPIADVPVAGGDPVIGDRAYGTDATKVANNAKA